MGLITEKIVYNVRERGRKHTGQDRNFDTAALAELVNGKATQERVKLGDMVGYYGHWPRIKLGMMPPEAGIIDGVMVNVVPAFRTIELSATPDGTITHRAEFLDNEPGQISESLFKSEQGGFSSAIESVPRTSPAVPTLFAGLDFVLSPNFSTNRGHKTSLDSTAATDFSAMFDSAIAQAAMADAEMVALFHAIQDQHAVALDTVERMHRENEILMARLMRAGKAPAGSTLDSIGLEDVRVAPVRIVQGSVSDMQRFRGAELPRLADLPTPASEADGELSAIRSRYGFGRV